MEVEERIGDGDRVIAGLTDWREDNGSEHYPGIRMAVWEAQTAVWLQDLKQRRTGKGAAKRWLGTSRPAGQSSC